jgi:guanosine-3',5'-bis(diphosphate) 3'-pyrophosphohydrolase
MNNIINNLVEQAIVKALELHHGQTRKTDERIPYIVHPLEVGLIIARYSTAPELIAAAILHDTVEDCDYKLDDLEQAFGKEVRNMVAALSEDKTIGNWVDRKNENLARLRKYNDAYVIKAADALANMRSLVDALKELGPGVWNHFNATKAKKLEYFKLILDDTEALLPKRFLEEYVAALKDLEYSEYFEKKSAIGFAV